MDPGPAKPASLGRYRVLGRIASGGMADVYAGCVKGEAGFERTVAIKRMAAALADDEEFITLFLHEARLAARIRSAHVAQTLDLGRGDDGVPYLVMDLVVGASLARLVAGAAKQSLLVPLDVALNILVDACRGLHDAHEATDRNGTPLGIVHRDVSPHNILVGEDGLSRVADFGIARALDSSSEMTRDRMCGKLAYFSPEQASGAPLDRRSDVFSLGVVAWELLAGQRLFCSGHAARTLERVKHDPIAPVDSVRNDVPAQLAQVVAHALERNPSDRFPTASDFESALRDAARQADLQLLPSSVAAFLRSCCAEDLRQLEALLRNRVSLLPGAAHSVPRLAPGSWDQGVTTEPERDRSASGTADRTTEPVQLTRQRHASSPPAAQADASVPESRRKPTRILWPGLALLAVLAVLAGWWGRSRPTPPAPVAAAASVVHGPPPPPSSRDLLRVGTTFFSSIPASHLAPALFWSVVEAGSEGRLKASFVRQIPTLENGAARILPGGKLEVRWELLPSLTWSDGSPLRSDDLVMSYRMMPSARTLEASKVDAQTASFLWTDQWAQAVDAFEPFPAGVFGPILDSEGREAALEYRKTHPTPGLGPYRVADVRIGEWMSIEANPYFAGPPPSIRRIELHCSKNTADLVQKFERGELDVIEPNSITVEQAEDLKTRRPEAVHLRPSSHYVLLQPDLTQPLLASVEARQALLTAIDRVALTREVYGRTDLVAHCPVLGLGDGAVKIYPFHAQRAASDLARLKLAGASFPLFHSPWAVDQRIARLLRDNLVAAGLTITLHQVDHVSELVRKGHHGGFVLYFLRDVGPEVVAAHFNLPALDADYDRSVRHSGFDDWTASLLDREERAVDPERRAQLRRELWMAFSERLPVLPLAFLLERVVVDPALRGWDGNPAQRFGADMERWYFVK